MTNYSWTTNTSGDWGNTADWTPAAIPNDTTVGATANVTIDAATTLPYTVTLSHGEAVIIDSLTVNAVNNLLGSNAHPYAAAQLEIDGTLTFAPGSAGNLRGSLQTYMVMNNGTIVNAGTVDAFIQGEGNVLFTGTNGFYVTNWLQALGGTVTVDTLSIAEMTGTTLFDGIFEAKGPGATVNLGGPLENLNVDITKMEGPPTIADGWTELLMNGPDAAIKEWNATTKTYVTLESTLTDISSRGTLDVQGGRNYTTANTLTVDSAGMLNLEAGTFTAAALNINGGTVQGFATIANNVVNNGTLIALNGTLDVTGSLTGTGVVGFDTDEKPAFFGSAVTPTATGATLELGAVSAGQTITMNSDDTLILTTPAAFAGTITAPLGGRIVLQGVTATSAVDNAGTLVVSNGSQTVATLALAGSYAGDTFTATGSTITITNTPPPVEVAGVTSLVQVGNSYELNPVSGGTGPTLTDGGSAVTVGQFGAWGPIGAEQTATGYEVAWKATGADQYIVWNTDSAGNYTSSATGVVSGSSLALQQLEPSFKQDLNGDGQIGPVTTVIAAQSGTSLAQVGNSYVFTPVGGTPVTLTNAGSAVTVGQFGAWAPVAATQTATGYEVVWKATGADQYIVWNTDSAGNYTSSATGVVSGSSLALQQLEPSFKQDLNGDGQIGPITTVLSAQSGTSLAQVGDTYALTPADGSAGATLTDEGSAVTVGQFGTWTPIGADQTATGYQVVWKATGADQYIVWNTDSAGNYTSSATGVVSGSSLALQQLEPSFKQDLNGDSQIGPITKVLSAQSGTSLAQVGDTYALTPADGSAGATLTDEGSAVTVGQFGAWTPIGADQTASGYQVVWKATGADQYIVWNTDSAGNYTSSATGVIGGQDFALEQLEPSFHQDLNGDGRLSTVLTMGTSDGDTLDLTGQTQAVTINLEGDTASASSGLNVPSLSFIGTPDAITLGSGPSTVEYALSPDSGIETIANFSLGQSTLNIDLMGAAASDLQTYDTTVGGVKAIAIYNSADPAHGMVLLNMPGGQTAANLLANHVTFSEGHALVG